MPASPEPDPHADGDIRKSYIRVIVVWVIVLASLYAFQEYFS